MRLTERTGGTKEYSAIIKTERTARKEITFASLFNQEKLGRPRVPKNLKRFYKQMEVPIEACDYSNLAAMRYLGVTHLTYHWYVGTTTVGFGSLAAPALYNCDVEGLKTIFRSDRDPTKGPYPSPFDYTFADLHEITADPCPVALIYDYHSPYEKIPDISDKDFLISLSRSFSIGWASALFDTTSTFYYPLPNGEKLDRVLQFEQDFICPSSRLSDVTLKSNRSMAGLSRPVNLKKSH